jgi:hypothetical protein
VLIRNIDRGLLLATAAAVLVLLSGRWWIGFLRRHNIRKRARNEGSDTMVAYRQDNHGWRNDGGTGDFADYHV